MRSCPLGLASLALVTGLVACGAPRRLPPAPVEAIEVADASAAPAPVGESTPAPAPAPPVPAPTASPVELPAAAEADRDDLREATFRHMFQKNASGLQQNARVICLEVEGDKDPTPALLARFRDLAVPVRAGSGCTMSASGGVVDKATGARGLAFRVDAIKKIDLDHAEVEGGYYEAGLSASGNVYTLERRKGGAWVVTKDVMRWIS